MTEVREDLFYIKNCALSAIATGECASSLLELRDKLAVVDEGCIYYHFWGGRMNPQFVHTQHHNDFAFWIFHRLHDQILAERLSVIDPTEFNSLEALRQELIETIENRMDDYEIILWIKKEDRFNFIRSSTIVFNSQFKLTRPEDLLDVLPKLPLSSIFYHFIDARSRTEERVDDFSLWIRSFGEEYIPLVEEIRAIDPYFLALRHLKDELLIVIQRFFHHKRRS